MTSYDVAQALARRWWVLALGLVATFSFALTHAPYPTIYWARYDLHLVAPDRSGEVYSRTTAPSGVTPVAGVLEVMLDGNRAGPQAATQSVPIFGLRYRTGVEVQAKDKGFQWSRDYVAALAVQIAEPTREAVMARAADLAVEARAALRDIQDREGVPRPTRVVLEEPSAIDVTEIYPARTRAMAGAIILGSGLSVVITVVLDRWLMRRRRRSAASA